MPYATAPDRVRLYYEEVGSGEPLLLVSGQGTDHAMWDGIRDDFASRRRVIVFDYRGTGASDGPSTPPYSTRGFARDAVAILDHLDITRAHAYGISMGGRVCQWLGIDAPERFGALVLGCTTPGNAHGIARSPDVDAQVFGTTDPEARLAAFLDVMYSPTWVAAHPDVVALARERFSNPIPAEFARLHYQASEGHDAWHLLPTIAVPTLVIHGSEDVLNPTANAPLLAERIPEAELYLVAGGRHGYFVEFREEASGVVNEFLARHALEAETLAPSQP